MGDSLQLAAGDGHLVDAYLARPSGAARGGLVVIQDAYGLGDYIRGVCDSYAADGYAAIAPALYDRQKRQAVFAHGGAAQDEARQLRAGLQWDGVVADIDAARAQVAPYGKVGIVGFCVGGSAAWIAAARLPFAAASAYYGRDIVDFLDEPPHCPAILHFGDRDRLIPLADVERVRARHPTIPAYVYPTGHGFDGPGKSHDAASAATARARSLALFRQHLG
jgi:carboxymethylenebutenolidase